MRVDTPPSADDDVLSDIPTGLDDIEIVDEAEIEGYMDESIEIPDNSTLTFDSHSGAVFCCAFDNGAQYAVSGGQDDKGFVWNARTGTTMFECKGHKDSVITASFNHDSKFVATGDMGGCIQVWDCSAYSSPFWSYTLDEDLRFLEWHPQKNVLFAGAADGSCWFWDLPERGESAENVMVCQSYGTASICGHWMPDGLKSVVGYEDGSVRIWSAESNLLHAIQGRSGHSASVSVIDCHPDSNLVISGSIDGTAKLIKGNDGRVLCTLRCEPEDTERKSVEGVGFFSSQQLIATGTVCGSLAIWDIPTQVRRLQCEQQSGITQLICDPTLPMVYTSGIDGVIRLFDGRTGQEEMNWSGHMSSVLYFTISRDGRLILTASDDCSCKIFENTRR